MTTLFASYKMKSGRVATLSLPIYRGTDHRKANRIMEEYRKQGFEVLAAICGSPSGFTYTGNKPFILEEKA